MQRGSVRTYGAKAVWAHTLHVCVHVCLFVCKGGTEAYREGGGVTLYFSFLAYQPWRASMVQLKAMHLTHVNVHAIIAPFGSKWKQHLAISQYTAQRRPQKPTTSLSEKCPCTPTAQYFTRSSGSSWQGTQLSVYTGRLNPTLWRFLLIMSQCSITSQLFAFSKRLKKCRKGIVIFSLGKYTNKKGAETT